MSDLGILQRPPAGGRAITNLAEVTSMLRRSAPELRVSVIENVEALSWVKQFRTFQAGAVA